MNKKITFATYQAASAPLRAFDPQADEAIEVEVAEWPSGEGWNIAIGEKTISLSCDELDAIIFLRDCIRFKDMVKNAQDY